MRPASRDGAGPTSGVQSLDRAVALLNTFTAERSELSVSELARATGLNRSTAHRLLAALQVHELVQQVPGSRNYALGPHTLRLARVGTARMNLRHLALPVMTRLRDASNETVGLSLLDTELRRVVIEQVESCQALRRTYTEIDQPIPIHQGAPGKLLLAYLPEAEREAVLSRPLAAVTPHTITDARRLRAELDRVRERGFALSFQERVHDICTLAVPVWDYTRRVVAALSVTGPSSRLGEDTLISLAPLARQAAEELSAKLGHGTDPEGRPVPDHHRDDRTR